MNEEVACGIQNSEYNIVLTGHVTRLKYQGLCLAFSYQQRAPDFQSVIGACHPRLGTSFCKAECLYQNFLSHLAKSQPAYKDQFLSQSIDLTFLIPAVNNQSVNHLTNTDLLEKIFTQEKYWKTICVDGQSVCLFAYVCGGEGSVLFCYVLFCVYTSKPWLQGVRKTDQIINS